MCVSPQNPHVEILTASVMALWGRAFGRWSGHEDGALKNEISFLRRDSSDSLALFSIMWRCIEKWAVCIQEVVLARHWILGFQDCERQTPAVGKPPNLCYPGTTAQPQIRVNSTSELVRTPVQQESCHVTANVPSSRHRLCVSDIHPEIFLEEIW